MVLISLVSPVLSFRTSSMQYMFIPYYMHPILLCLYHSSVLWVLWANWEHQSATKKHNHKNYNKTKIHNEPACIFHGKHIRYPLSLELIQRCMRKDEKSWILWKSSITMQWRYNGRDDVSNHQPASRLFTQPFTQAQIKENIDAPRHWPLCGKFTGDRWILPINGQ